MLLVSEVFMREYHALTMRQGRNRRAADDLHQNGTFCQTSPPFTHNAHNLGAKSSIFTTSLNRRRTAPVEPHFAANDPPPREADLRFDIPSSSEIPKMSDSQKEAPQAVQVDALVSRIENLPHQPPLTTKIISNALTSSQLQGVRAPWQTKANAM
jgi:hypothetical protein